MKFNSVEQLKNLINYDKEEICKKELSENFSGNIQIISLTQNKILKTNLTAASTMFYVVEGEILFNEKNINHVIQEGETIFLREGEKYTVLAQKNSKVMIIRLN